MRQLLSIFCALLLCCACAAAEQDARPVETYLLPVPLFSAEEPGEALLGVDLDAAVALAPLGEPLSFFESPSCAFQGMDKVYTFPSLVVNTYPEQGKDLILSIYLTDDALTTGEGAYIGMHTDEILALYGEPTRTADASLTFEKGGCALSFLYDAEGFVTSILYESIRASAQ